MNPSTAAVPLPGGRPPRRRAGSSRRKDGDAPLSAWKASLDPVRLGLLGMMFVNISAIQMYLGPLQLLRPGLLCLIIAVLGVVTKPSRVQWSNFKAWPVKAVLVLLFLACCSALFGISLGGAARYIMNIYFRNLIFFFLLVLAIRNVGDLAVLIWSFVLSVGIFIVLAQTVLGMDTSGQTDRLSGGSGIFDANDLGMILLMALPLAFLLFYNSGKLGRITTACIILGIPVTVALTGSRGALIGMVALAIPLFFALHQIKIVTRVFVFSAVAAGLFIGAPAGYWERMSTLLEATEDENVTADYGRLNIAKRGMGYMFRYPIFGVGVMNFAWAELTISPIRRERQRSGQAVQMIAPHNTYAEVGAEMGMIALGIWLSLLWGGTIGMLRLRQKIPESWETESSERRFLRQACLFLPGTFWAFAVPSFFLSHAYTMVFYIPVAYMAGTILLVRKELALDRGGASQPKGRRGASRPRRQPMPAPPSPYAG